MADRTPPRLPLPVRPLRPGLATAPEDELVELRVRIPVDLHRQLLSLKVLRGRSLAETVSIALDIYFADEAKAKAKAQAAPAVDHALTP